MLGKVVQVRFFTWSCVEFRQVLAPRAGYCIPCSHMGICRIPDLTLRCPVILQVITTMMTYCTLHILQNVLKVLYQSSVQPCTCFQVLSHLVFLCSHPILAAADRQA